MDDRFLQLITVLSLGWLKMKHEEALYEYVHKNHKHILKKYTYCISVWRHTKLIVLFCIFVIVVWFVPFWDNALSLIF